ncbi:RNA-directed DNA polymerase -like protein [Trichinella sp. T9]|nr:RNA-directed DNA polymerase -like protein [Trichinella sp. T9]
MNADSQFQEGFLIVITQNYLLKNADNNLCVLFCVDYRKLNEVTRKNAQPLSRIDATQGALAGAKWFTILDLASGYC